MSTDRGPGIARADRPRRGEFASFLERLAEDDDALDGLAFAYTALSAPDRRRLARAVAQDVPNPAQGLGLLLALEEDGAVAAELVALMRSLAADGPTTATHTVGPSGSEVCLVHPSFGLAPEVMRITQTDHDTVSVCLEPLESFTFEGRTQVPLAQAIDTAAPALWRYLRSGGTMPHGAAHFAPLFSAR
ncbi:MAG: hypothetical protein AAF436_11170 [Myxococcota bacterium]